MATEKGKKRVVLSLEQRIKAIEQLDQGKPAYKIAEEFGVGKTQIQNLRKRKHELINDYENNVPGETKRRRYLTGNEEINTVTYEWFKDAVSRRINITGPLIQEQALHFASKQGNLSFKASKGWLESFIKRHNISFGSMSGERGDVKQSTIIDWTEKLPKLCENYEAKDIFNMDETGLFFRDSGRKTYRMKGDDCAGGKRSKERITVALCASLTGEKIKPLVIGKSRSPRCFGRMDVKALPVDYYFNKKAWMNSYIYEEFLKKLNRKMANQNRNILLFVDNAPSHPTLHLSNVKVQFLPPNTTSLTQPMDQGIIQTLKLKFRKRQLQHMVRGMEQHPTLQGSDLLKQITILDAIYWISNSWAEVEEVTIMKCFSKAGFNDGTVSCVHSDPTNGTNDDDDDDDVPLKVMQMSIDLFGCDFKDLIKLDKDFHTCETQHRDWDMPIESLLSELIPDKCTHSLTNDEDYDSDENGDSLSMEVPSYSEASEFVNKLKLLAINTGNSTMMDTIVKYDDELCKIVAKKPKQSQITDFFQKRNA